MPKREPDDVEHFIQNAEATRNIILSVMLAIAMTLEVMGLRSLDMGRKYATPATSWIGALLIWANLIATPLVWASGVVVDYPVLSAMMTLLAGMTVLRFLLHRRTGRRLVWAMLRGLCTILEAATAKLTWFPTQRVTQGIQAFSPPVPHSLYFWGYSPMQRWAGRILPVGQWEDEETGEIKGIRPVTFQLGPIPTLLSPAAK